jgi:serine/threonine protein kinase
LSSGSEDDLFAVTAAKCYDRFKPAELSDGPGRHWRTGNRPMSVPISPGSEELPVSGMRRVEEICVRFEDGWKAGQRPRIEEYLGDIPEAERSHLLRELLALELVYRRQGGETPTAEDYQQRFPEHAELVKAAFHNAAEAKGKAESSDQQVSTGPDVAHADEPAQPLQLGRYKITAKLGAGGFGIVYRGYDEELRRDVAIKVPHHQRITEPEDVEKYLAEARILASLDHPHIVPVYDVGRTEDGLCYVVSKYIEGSDLATKLKQSRPSLQEAVELVTTVAEALHYAHRHGLVHRDIKPGNILLDKSGKPFVGDFGLALTEKDFGKNAGLFGTPRYMSPEQACQEGHRVDGRSDIFSLGVVIYELLTGRCPFRGETQSELLEQIATVEARPPRQMDDSIPKELERICLRALSLRPSERYTTARDLADDLNGYLKHELAGEGSRFRGSAGPHGQVLPASPYQGDKRKRSKKTWKAYILAILSLLAGSMVIVVLMHGRSSNELTITRVRIASDQCYWDQLYKSEQVIGFKQIPKHVVFSSRRKWFDSPKAQELTVVYSYMKPLLEKKQRDGLAGLDLLPAESYEAFCNRFTSEVFGFGSRQPPTNGNDLAYLRAIWPSNEEKDALRSKDRKTYDALSGFERDYFRAIDPLFDVIIESSSAREIVVHSALLEVRNFELLPAALFQDGPRTLNTLRSTAEYEWSLRVLDDVARVARSLPIHEPLREKLTSRFELDPPLVINASQPIRFRIRFARGYVGPHQWEMRFVFLYDQQNSVASRWYSFCPNRGKES